VAEFCDVATVLGEQLCTFELLTGTPVAGKGAADVCIVRPDGLRIAVEMTASIPGQSVERKVDRWCEMLSRTPVQDSGLVVLFVNAPHQDASQAAVTYSLDVVKKAISGSVRRHPGTASSPTAERIGVVSWQALFPSAGQVSSDFPTLPVTRPTGRGYLMGGDDLHLWERADLLDPGTLPLAPNAARDAIVDNARVLRGTPFFLRGDGGPDLTALAVRNAGITVA
ncbi:MAG: hypothetical protein B7X32_20400, partial [Microbacterium sp. 13-71-7]